MSWAAPLYFLLLIAVALVAGLMLWFGRRHLRRLEAAFRGKILERVLPKRVRTRRLVRDVAALLGLVALVVSLAEPRYGKQIIEIEQKGVDVVLVVDLSLSMDATDVDPSRLERARREIRDLLEMVEGDRLGLVIYAGGAFPRMPLTADKDALKLLVNELDTASFQSQGSQLGEALREAAKLFGEVKSEAGRAVLVLSDGEVHRKGDAVAAAEELAEKDIVIFGMLIGEEASPIPLADGTLLRHEGQLVQTEPTMDVLRELAKVTGGATVMSVPSNDDMRRIYVDGIRGQLQAATRGSTKQEVWQSGFQLPLAIGVLLLLLAGWIGDGRRALKAGLAVLLAVLTLSWSPAQAADLADADAAYRSGRWQQAIREYTELVGEQPTNADLYDRLGAARYRAGDFEGASRAWETQLRLVGDDPLALYNAGNAHYQAGRLEEAEARYERALSNSEGFGAAQQNLELVKQELSLRRQKKPPKNQEGDSSGEAGSGESDEQSESESAGGSEGEESEGKGEGGEQGEQGEPGDESDGKESDGDDNGESSSDSQESKGENGGEGSQTGDTTDEREESEGVDPSELDGMEQSEGNGGEGDPGEAQVPTPAKDGEITEQQAEKMLEGVQEGRPRVVIPGEGNKKPW